MIDTHTHAWEAPRPDHPWVNEFLIERINSFDEDIVYDSDELLADMDAQSIDRAVVVSYPITNPYDNSTVIEVTRKHERLDGIGLIDPFAETAAEQLRSLMANDGIVGIRIGVIYARENRWQSFDESAEWLYDVLEDELWEAAKETDAVIQILADISQLDQIKQLIETHSELNYFLDHFLQVNPIEPPGDGPFADLQSLSSYSNVAVKISEAPHISNESFPYHDLHEYVRWLLEHFGREQIMWGSDYPNVSDTATYDETYEWLQHIDYLSSADRRWFTERTYENFIK